MLPLATNKIASINAITNLGVLPLTARKAK